MQEIHKVVSCDKNDGAHGTEPLKNVEPLTSATTSQREALSNKMRQIESSSKNAKSNSGVRETMFVKSRRETIWNRSLS